MAEINPNGAAMLAAAKKNIASAPMKYHDVPEWPDADGKPSRIWYKPMTPNERFDIFAWKANTGDIRHRHAYCIIRRALDQNGNRLFTLADEETLLELDAGVVLRISDVLIAIDVTVADAKKGFETTPTA